MPEENKAEITTTLTMSAEQQLAELRTTLAGHRAFGICRGKFGAFDAREMLKCEKPTQTLMRFEEWIGPQRVMLSLLANLKRAGHMYAFTELQHALTSSSYVITGEEIPLEQTESGVLIMFDPEKVLLLARWLYTSNWKDGNQWVTHGTLNPDRMPCGTLTAELLEALPGLRESFLEKADVIVLIGKIHRRGWSIRVSMTAAIGYGKNSAGVKKFAPSG